MEFQRRQDMRAILRIAAVTAFIGLEVQAQDALTFSFDGRIGLGYLREETARPSDGGFLADGFQYKGPVAKVELTGRAEFLAMEDLRLGALGRFSYLRGNQSTYDLTRGGIPTGGSGSDFGGSELDLAVYATSPIVTLSYGDMETAFDLATREIEQGSSILDGGNAVWMNIGDASGSTGTRSYPFRGPAVAPDFRTLRLDLQLGEVTISASRSKADIPFFGEIQVDAAGAVWRHEVEAVTLFVGAGYDEGRSDRFRSFSFGFTSGGLNLVINKIHRDPLVFSRGTEASYDTTFRGLSLSYDFGDVTLGMAQASQSGGPGGMGVFEGSAQAVFASWQARENVSVDFEYSQTDYRVSSGFDTRKASLAVALEF
jgi:hypothetical protein